MAENRKKKAFNSTISGRIVEAARDPEVRAAAKRHPLTYFIATLVTIGAPYWTTTIASWGEAELAKKTAVKADELSADQQELLRSARVTVRAMRELNAKVNDEVAAGKRVLKSQQEQMDRMRESLQHLHRRLRSTREALWDLSAASRRRRRLDFLPRPRVDPAPLAHEVSHTVDIDEAYRSAESRRVVLPDME